MALSRAQQRAIEALLGGSSFGEAATAAGVSQRTLYEWRRTEAFAGALRTAQRDAMQHATVRLARACASAVDALERILGDEDAPHAAVVSAARTVLEHASKALELDDIAARLEKIEAAHGDSEPTKPITQH